MRALGRWSLSAAVAAVLVLSSVSCGPTVDLAQGLQVSIVDSGWYDMGIVNGQNKLVPSVTYTLKNVSDQKLVMLQVNALFRRVNDPGEWGDALITAAGSSGLAAGAQTGPFTARSQRGYTGSDQSRQDMLNHHLFVDAKVELLAKYGSTQWKRLGEYPIKRVLIEKQPGK
jgi:hypothetical protein